MTSIRRTSPTFELDHKRFYLPFVITDECLKCGQKVKRDLGIDYISYPILGSATWITLCHYTDDNEEHSWDVEIIVDVTVKLLK